MKLLLASLLLILNVNAFGAASANSLRLENFEELRKTLNQKLFPTAEDPAPHYTFSTWNSLFEESCPKADSPSHAEVVKESIQDHAFYVMVMDTILRHAANKAAGWGESLGVTTARTTTYASSFLEWASSSASPIHMSALLASAWDGHRLHGHTDLIIGVLSLAHLSGKTDEYLGNPEFAWLSDMAPKFDGERSLPFALMSPIKNRLTQHGLSTDPNINTYFSDYRGYMGTTWGAIHHIYEAQLTKIKTPCVSSTTVAGTYLSQILDLEREHLPPTAIALQRIMVKALTTKTGASSDPGEIFTTAAEAYLNLLRACDSEKTTTVFPWYIPDTPGVPYKIIDSSSTGDKFDTLLKTDPILFSAEHIRRRFFLVQAAYGERTARKKS